MKDDVEYGADGGCVPVGLPSQKINRNPESDPETRIDGRQLGRWSGRLALGVLVVLCLLVRWRDDGPHLTPNVGGESAEDALEGTEAHCIEHEGSKRMPDFDAYIHMDSLSDDELHFDDPSRRVVVVGDVHGRPDVLENLLEAISFSPTTDTLLYTGDVLTKGPTPSTSLIALDLLMALDAKGVRGNHDQMVLAWWKWRGWVAAHEGGEEWLERLDDGEWERDEVKRCPTFPSDFDSEQSSNLATDPKRSERTNMTDANGGGGCTWPCVPSDPDWKPFDKHYKLARLLTPSQASFLVARPLVLHIPRLHAALVHAGLVPMDLRWEVHDDRQPLARVPGADSVLGSDFRGDDVREEVWQIERGEMVEKKSGRRDWRREVQEMRVLIDIPANTDPWSLLNLRSIRDNLSLSKENDEGWPWAMLWNALMDRCAGFPPPSLADERGEKTSTLPCNPMTVIYGHAASRGLSIDRWTKGLDSGCNYQHRLTALVLRPPGDSDIDYERLLGDVEGLEVEDVVFGDEDGSTARAHVVSVSCEL